MMLKVQEFRRRLRKGLKELDEKVSELILRYGVGEMDLEEYLRLRIELERKRLERVAENLGEIFKSRRPIPRRARPSQDNSSRSA